MDLAGRRVLVVGLGKSGQAAARFLARRGAAVTGNDARTALPDEVAASLRAAGVSLDLGGHDAARFAAADLIVLSPGVPKVPALEAADRAGVPVVSEVELASRFLRGPIAAITGTNGKSTTTELLGAMCRAAGWRVFVGGNLGTPLVEAAEAEARDGGPLEAVVAEVSSFQLERTSTFRPRVASIINVTEDHLDRYRSMDEYVAAKARIFARMGSGDHLVLNADDPRVASLGREVRPGTRVTWISLAGRPGEARPEPGSATLVGREGRGALLFAPREGEVERYPLARITLAGRHNLENMLVAVAMGRRLGVPAEAIQRALESFGSLAHRIEKIGEVSGVGFYDDSKGTNVGAVVRALESFATPVVLIAGGKDKGGDYAPLAPLVKSRVRRLVLIGEAVPKLEAALGGLTDTVRASSLPAAVDAAFAGARPGDSVLFSPACSSFDMFRDYLHRSEVFAEAVRALAARAGASS